MILGISLDHILDEYSLDNLMESKISKLHIDSDSLNIVIGGDSRGERQLIPYSIESKTGYNSINISVTAGEIVSTAYALDVYSAHNNVYI